MVHIVADLEMNWLDFKYENERSIGTVYSVSLI